MSSGEAISVVVRCRPFIGLEKKECTDCVRISSKDGVIRVGDPSVGKEFSPTDIKTWRLFTYDTVYDKTKTQQQVFDKSVQPVFQKVLRGLNSTIFCYGQTSSGKTFTMMGDLNNPAQYGIIPKLSQALFEHIKSPECKDYKFAVTISFLEIYNEKVFDLLTGSRKDLKIRQTKSKGFHVPKLSNMEVESSDMMFRLIKTGFNNRSTSETKQNEGSSRSHSILTMNIVKEAMENSEKAAEGKIVSKLNLVDLAGSERFADQNQQLGKESRNINQSLSTLANVISALAQKKKAFVPYRNSALTKLLKDSLGGNASTLMFANINPCDRNAAETVSTLRYAQSAKKIKNKPKVQIYLDPKNKMLQELKDEIERLKQQLASRDRVIEGFKQNELGATPDAYETPATPKMTSPRKETKRTIEVAVPEPVIHKNGDGLVTLENPQLYYLKQTNQELLDELNETKQREQELDQEIDALTSELQKLERREVELEDKCSLMERNAKLASHREAVLDQKIKNFETKIGAKFKEKSEHRKMVDLYKTEAQTLRSEKAVYMQLLEDFKNHQKSLDEQLAREQEARMDLARIVDSLKVEKEKVEKEYKEEKKKVEELCVELVDSRNILEAQSKAAEEAEKQLQKSMAERKAPGRRRPSFAIKIAPDTKKKLNELITPMASREPSPRESVSGMSQSTSVSRASAMWKMSSKMRSSINLANIPRAFRRSLLISPDEPEKELTAFQSAWANALAQFLNICLESESDLIVAGLIPVKMGIFTTIRQMSTPLLLARYLNYIGRATLDTHIDESSVGTKKYKREPTYQEKINDMNLILGACKMAGVKIGKLNAKQIVEKDEKQNKRRKTFTSATFNPEKVLELVQVLVEFHLSQRISLEAQPELEELGGFKAWGIDELKVDELKKLEPKQLLLRWVNLNLYTSVNHFEEKGQNLEAVLEVFGVKLPLIDFSNDWGVLVVVLILTGLIARAGKPNDALSFASEVMTEDDFERQVEIVEDVMRTRGGAKALAFFLGEVEIGKLTAKETDFLRERINSLFAMAILNESSGAELPYDDKDGYDTDENDLLAGTMQTHGRLRESTNDDLGGLHMMGSSLSLTGDQF